MKNLNLIVEETPKNASNFAVVSFRKDMDLVWFQGNTIEECEHWINLQREDSEVRAKIVTCSKLIIIK